MNNVKLRTAIFTSGLKQWEVARLIGIHEGSLSRRLRDELPAEEQDRIIKIIEKHKLDVKEG